MLEGRSRGGSGGSASTHTTALSGAVADREAEVAPPELVGTDGRDHQGNEGAAAQPPHRAVVVPAAVGGQAERRHRPLHRTQAARIYESGLPRHLGAPQSFSTPKRHSRRCWECRCPPVKRTEGASAYHSPSTHKRAAPSSSRRRLRWARRLRAELRRRRPRSKLLWTSTTASKACWAATASPPMSLGACAHKCADVIVSSHFLRLVPQQPRCGGPPPDPHDGTGRKRNLSTPWAGLSGQVLCLHRQPSDAQGRTRPRGRVCRDAQRRWRR